MTTNAQILDEVKDVVIDTVNLTHIDKNELDHSTPLMNGPLELDSVDILELVVAIEHHFKVKVASSEEGKEAFQTLGSISDFIEKRKQA